MKKPVRGTHEWASTITSCVSGCENNCHYCWAKAYAIRDGKKTPENWSDEVVDSNAVNKNYGKRKGTIMFPATHDIRPDNLHICCSVLERMLNVGNKVLIVSKPHIECIDYICNRFPMYKSQILFRFTIGSVFNEVLKFWEPNAPLYQERLSSLVLAYKLGFETSISCEPMLDNQIHEVVSDTLPYVTDAIWLGKANDLINRLTINGADKDVLDRAKELVELQNDENMWKLYEQFKNNPKIKWKDSIKQIVGIERPTKKGLDV